MYKGKELEYLQKFWNEIKTIRKYFDNMLYYSKSYTITDEKIYAKRQLHGFDLLNGIEDKIAIDLMTDSFPKKENISVYRNKHDRTIVVTIKFEQRWIKWIRRTL